MNDRLAELRAAGANEVILDMDAASPAQPESLKKRGSNYAKPTFMRDFFQDVEVVKTDIVGIREATKNIADINQQAMLATTAEREAELSRGLNPLIQETNKQAAHAKALLQQMRDSTAELKEANQTKQSEIRIRENLQNTLTRKFVDVMKEYQNAQQKYKTDIKKKVKRQVQIVKPDATTEEIDAVMRAGGGAGDVFRTAILRGEAADPIRNAYMNVADKYQDVLTLEASVAELHQMFLDFALLTERQGELLDQIEYQVKSASDYIEDANQDMTKAIEYQKSIRKKQCILIVIVLVIIGIILAAVFGSQSNN